MSLSLSQRRALAIVPKVTGVLSMIGSSFVITDVLRDRKKLEQTYSRLVLGFSCVDFLASFAMFLSTWPIPSDSGVLGASGNVGTCNYQGFFIQFNITVSWYNLCLAIYYLLVITYKWSDLRVKKVEKYLHLWPILFGLGTSISSIPQRLYNNSNFWCWIGALPASCGNTRDATGVCERGDDAWLYRWAYFYGPLWFIIFALSAVMAVVSYSVWAGEKASRKYRSHGSSSQNNKLASLARQVAWQSLCYVMAFYATWTFPTVLRLMQTIGADVPFAIQLLFVICTPSQGFLNACVYIRPRYVRFRQLHPDDSSAKVMGEAIKMTYPCLGPCLRSCRRLCRGKKIRKPSTLHGDDEELVDEPETQHTQEDSGYEFGDDYNSVDDVEALNPAYALQKSAYRLEVSQNFSTQASEVNLSMEFDGLSPEVPIRERIEQTTSRSMTRLERASQIYSKAMNQKRHRSTPAFPVSSLEEDENDDYWERPDDGARRVAFADDTLVGLREETNPDTNFNVREDSKESNVSEEHGFRGRFAHIVAKSVQNLRRHGSWGDKSKEVASRNDHPQINGQGNEIPDEIALDPSPCVSSPVSSDDADESPRKAKQWRVDGVISTVYEEEA